MGVRRGAALKLDTCNDPHPTLCWRSPLGTTSLAPRASTLRALRSSSEMPHPEAAQPALARYGPEGAAQLRGVGAADDVAGERQVLQRHLQAGIGF